MDDKIGAIIMPTLKSTTVNSSSFSGWSSSYQFKNDAINYKVDKVQSYSLERKAKANSKVAEAKETLDLEEEYYNNILEYEKGIPVYINDEAHYGLIFDDINLRFYDPINKVYYGLDEVDDIQTRHSSPLADSIAETMLIILIGLGQGVEPVIDCAVQTTSEIFWGANAASGLLLSLLGCKEGQEATKLFKEELEKRVADFVGTNWTKVATVSALKNSGLYNEEHEGYIDHIRTIENSIGVAMISKLPGIWSAIALAIISEGQAAEKAYQEGANFGQTTAVSHIEGVIAFVRGLIMKRISEETKLTSEDSSRLIASGAASKPGMQMTLAHLKEIGPKGALKTIGLSTGTTIVTNVTKSLAH